MKGGATKVKDILQSDSFMNEQFPFYIMKTIQGAVQEHGHNFVELVYVVRGKGVHRFGGIDYEIQTGDVIIINPGETHSYMVQGEERMEIINCLFMPSFISDTLLRELGISGSMDYFYVHPFLNTEVRFNHQLNLSGQDAASVLAILESMLRESGNRSPGYTFIIRLQLVELLILLSRYYTLMQKHRTVASPRRLDREITARRIYGYLERNYDKKITLQSLSELFNVSVRQLNRYMSQELGKSVVDVMHDIRIARAKHLLLESNEKVISIATMVGYEDPSFFSRLFFRHVGCSPSQYRTCLENQLTESI
ncbi:AraC family transcriptional regulator [Paenibacillus herberti]|uniref:AraC family transcriptional regulator n=1 Tax=Paenibacillus herberti TaxID=1619309 RepID=A0A229P2L9_9BACL|nr:AraC family transcriptional regulator [Paenibacillus herberti]OXM16301.1 AraC family transcriptional regulator [Paenibacillus herberti]